MSKILDLIARGYDRVTDKIGSFASKKYDDATESISDSVHDAQDRIIVFGSSGSGTNVTHFVIAIVLAFVSGFIISTILDYSGYREFRKAQFEIAQERETKIRAHEQMISSLEERLHAQEAARAPGDKEFADIINAAVDDKCKVPTKTDINPIIAGANQ